MYKNIILILVFFFNIQNISAQAYETKKTVSSKILKNYNEAVNLIRKGDDKKALQLLDKVLKKEPTFIDAKIERSGIFYREGDIATSEKILDEVVAVDPNYNNRLLYTLGTIKYYNDKYDEAASLLKQFLKTDNIYKTTKVKAEKLLKKAEFAALAVKNPVPFKPEALGNLVNTYNSEYLPSITADGELLIYTTRIWGQEDFYVSKNVDGVWQRGKPIGEPVNTEYNEGAQSISADGKMLVFTACNRKDTGYGSCDIYYSEIKNGEWMRPRNIGKAINTAGWESQPCLTPDGKAIYFASEREGTKGSKDLWVSYKQENGRWGKPKNLGDVINTPDEEQSPFIHPDGQTLYFMSRGHEGMGGHDLFMSRKDANGKWMKPVNLGYPINTKASEGSIFVSLDGKTAYFATDRQEKGVEGSAFDKKDSNKNTDLYKFELYEAARPQPVTYVKATVFDEITKKRLKAKIDFVNLTTGKSHISAVTDENGEFLVCLPMGQNYALNVNKKQYLFHSENFELTELRDLEKPFILKIGLQKIKISSPLIVSNKPKPVQKPEENKPLPLPKAKPIILKNIFFETAKATLRPESITELNQLKKLLEDNPTMKIQINGHTDNVGSDSDNQLLSENRAKAVRDYLIQNGITSTRISYKGYGESQPIDTNDTSEGRQLNRRTEFIVIE